MASDMRYAYTMPKAVNIYGEIEDQGRFGIAYSAGIGWLVIDSELMVVLFWAPTEERALEQRENLLERKEIKG